MHNFLEWMISNLTALAIEHNPGLQTCHRVYNWTAPSKFLYLQSLACYSAIIQLYAHLGQLPTALWLYSRRKRDLLICRFGCGNVVEDKHHVFIEYLHFAPYRLEAQSAVLQGMLLRCAELVKKGIISDHVLSEIILTAKSLFHDDPSILPLQYSAYYLGQIPDVSQLILRSIPEHTPLFKSNHLAHFFVSSWHLASIHLAGQIWGQVQHIAARQVGL